MSKPFLVSAALSLALASAALATPFDACGTFVQGLEGCVLFQPDGATQNVWAGTLPAGWQVGDHARVRGDYILCPSPCFAPCVTNAIVSVCTTGCRADFNRSGAATTADIFDFLNAWFAGSRTTDFDDSGTLAPSDILEFLAAWMNGC